MFAFNKHVFFDYGFILAIFRDNATINIEDTNTRIGQKVRNSDFNFIAVFCFSLKDYFCQKLFQAIQAQGLLDHALMKLQMNCVCGYAITKSFN